MLSVVSEMRMCSVCSAETGGRNLNCTTGEEQPNYRRDIRRSELE
ncbi:hypothetical protein scyTo_0023158, partial [Scyliorhinus torazame]|nr:hypothetical protein [Scyliorhinus torazame]